MQISKHYKGLVCIYMIESPNGKKYIGQTQNLYNRLRRYKYNLGKGQHKLYRSFVKYGFINHKLTVLKVCKLYEIDRNECFFIEKFNTIDSGLNIRKGGGTRRKENGYFHSKIEEQQKKADFLNIYMKLHKKRKNDL
jgi:group I intron endonuclease